MFQTDTLEFLYCGKVSDTRGLIFESHSHANYELIYFIEGRGHIKVPGSTLHPATYHLVVFPSGVPHEEFSDEYYPEHTIWLSAYIQTQTELDTPFMLTDKDGQFRWLFEQIYKEYMVNRNSSMQIITYLAKTIFLLIERYWFEDRSVVSDIVDFSIQYINNHFSEDIEIDKLASLSFISAPYLRKIFRKKTGISPKSFQNNIRIEAAKKYLATTDMTINKIADIVGYNNQLYFSKVFKTATSLHPSKFRQLAE